MGTRYGRKASDGTTEYHDSRESLAESERRENSDDRATFFGLIGIFIGGVLAYMLFLKFGGVGIPKWLRFLGIILGAGAGSFVLAKLANLIWHLILIVVASIILYGIGSAIWSVI